MFLRTHSYVAAKIVTNAACYDCSIFRKISCPCAFSTGLPQSVCLKYSGVIFYPDCCLRFYFGG